MRLPVFIAFRYLFSKKKINAINVINAIAMLGFGVGAFAMIVILSAFNGFENLLEGLINKYDPDIRISVIDRKVFTVDSSLEQNIRAIPEVKNISRVLEEKVVIKYNDRQEIARIKGVDANFKRDDFDSLIVLGHFDLGDSLQAMGIFGAGLSGKLGLFPGSQYAVSVFVPDRHATYNTLNPESALNIDFIRPSGIFMVHEEIDNEVFVAPLAFTSKLLGYSQALTALEVQLTKGADRNKLKKQISTLLGSSWKVETREEQNELIYKIFKSEKWFTYAILSLVLLISAFNIFGSLVMLVLDKKKDISILKSMGASEKIIRKVFVWQGSYIAVLGGGLGLLAGIVLVVLQKQYGWITLENSIVEAYPVVLHTGDILITLGTVVLLGYVISIYPALRASRAKTEALN